MKKILFISLAVLLFAQCGMAGNKETTNKENKEAVEPNIKHITRAQFLTSVFNYEKDTKVFNFLGKKPVIVDFYATWCGPCRQLSPILEELAGDYKGKLVIYKIDTDVEKQLAQDLGIQALPTLVFFPLKGKPIMLQGFRTKDELKKIIDSQLIKN